MAQLKPASISSNSFNCPHCASLAHQTWYALYASSMRKEDLPFIPNEETIHHLEQNDSLEPEIRSSWVDQFRRLFNGEVFLKKEAKAYADHRLENTWASRCYACDKFSIWLHGRLI